MSKYTDDRWLGAYPSYPDYRNYRVTSPTRLQVEALPETWEGLDEYVPDGIKGNPEAGHPDQGNIGQCVGFDASIVMEISNNIKANTFKDLSAWWIYNRSRFYAGIQDWMGEGSTNLGAMQALNMEGVVPEEICPTPKDIKPFECVSEEAYEIACNWAIDQYWMVNPFPNDVKAAMYGITHEMPYKMPDGSLGKTGLMSAFPVYQSFIDTVTTGGVVPLPKPGEKMLGGHSSPLIGWKDKNGIKYYKNYGSWGEDAGDRGVFWIPEEYPFYPNDYFIVHIGPPTNPVTPPSPSPCNVGNTSAKILNAIPWALHRKGRMFYQNPAI
jgi:hypothetical protein